MRDLGPSALPLLLAENVSLTVGNQRLLDSIDLSIARGRKLAVLGANGAGKSLLLRVLHGLIAPDCGDVRSQGQRLDAKARATQAMVFQKPVLLRRSVAANIRFALAAKGYGWRECRTRAQAALEHASLAHLAKRPARVLSGGEQQRLALARALACEPEILLLDEPTANLDPAATKAVEQMIETAHGRGVTVVFVTHDLGQARRLAEDVAFLQAGRVVEIGPAKSVLYQPLSPATQAWIEGRIYLDPPA